MDHKQQNNYSPSSKEGVPAGGRRWKVMARFFLPVGRQNDKMIVDFSFDTPSCYLFFSTEPINSLPALKAVLPL